MSPVLGQRWVTGGRLRRRLRQRAYRLLYRDGSGSLDRAVMIAGTARSGTTWLAEVVASQLAGRLMFEPFHSRIVPDFRDFEYFPYRRPDDEDDALREFSHRVLTGRIRDPWIDRYVEVLRPRFRVVKEIRANLFLCWMKRRFPELPLLYIIRHPCSVVASRLALGWATDGDLEPLLAQRPLREDFLADRMSLIESARRPEQKHAVLWCVMNLVPLRQFPPGQLDVVFYEDLCLDPEREISRVFRLLGRTPDGAAGAALERRSMTARPRSSAAPRPIDGWRSQLGPGQADAVLGIVRDFGLDGLYGDGCAPSEAARRRWRRDV